MYANNVQVWTAPELSQLSSKYIYLLHTYGRPFEMSSFILFYFIFKEEGGVSGLILINITFLTMVLKGIIDDRINNFCIIQHNTNVKF